MIRVNELVKVFPDDCKALDGVSFNIEEGEVCGYLGANGAGKSTTIRILAGMLSADRGEVSVNGIDVLKSPQRVKKIIGYVPESGAIFQSLTPYDFLEFVCRIHGLGKEIYHKRIYEFIELFDLKNEIRTPMSSFSKGMKQKVLIISSLIHNPEVIFWDEPLSGVDFNTNLLVRDLVSDLSEKGKIFFYSSHILDMVEKICSRVIILNVGRVVYDSQLNPDNDNFSLEEFFRKYTDTADIKVKTSEIYKNFNK
jgi:ABC-2 type transport system ATP-binding protein